MTADLYSAAALADHAAEIIYQVAKIDLGDTNAATTAVTEIDTLARILASLRDKLTGGQPGPVVDSAQQRLMRLIWEACDDGDLPADLDSVLLGEFFHTRPAGGAA